MGATLHHRYPTIEDFREHTSPKTVPGSLSLVLRFLQGQEMFSLFHRDHQLHLYCPNTPHALAHFSPDLYTLFQLQPNFQFSVESGASTAL